MKTTAKLKDEMKRVHFAVPGLGRALGVAALLFAGCRAPGIAQQRLVSQPAMTFSESPVWNYDVRLAPQTESGRGFAGGAGGAGCTSCR